jgi:hypothetical protein
MGSLLALTVSAGLLAASPLPGEGLKLTASCATHGLPLGAQVWIEVEPEYHEMAGPTMAETGTRDLRLPVAAETDPKHAWQFEVTQESMVSVAREFWFSGTANSTVSGEVRGGETPGTVRAIFLKTRVSVKHPALPFGDGEIHEWTFGMSVPSDATEVHRCVSLHADGGRLVVETAADCNDPSIGRTNTDRCAQVQIPLQSAPWSSQEIASPKIRIGTCDPAVHGCGNCLCFVCFLTFVDCTHYPSQPCFCDYADCVTIDHCV